MRISIVGAGVAGLAAAGLLAADGHDVDVFEATGEVGGRAGVLEAGGFLFETGPSFYLLPELLERLYRELGTSTEAEHPLYRLDPAYRILGDGGETLTLTTGGAPAAFEAREPGSGARLEAYLERAGRLRSLAVEHFLYTAFDRPTDLLAGARALPRLAPALATSLAAAAGRVAGDRLLRQALEYPAVFLAGEPKRVPALYGLLSHADLAEGVYFPAGGFSAVVAALERAALRQEARIHLRCPVESIDARAGRVRGVTVGGERVPADAVVACVDAHHAEHELLEGAPPEHPESWWRSRDPGPGAVVVLLGLTRALPRLSHHTFCFASDWQRDFDAVYRGARGHAVGLRALGASESVYVSRPTATEPGFAPPGGDALFILVPTRADPSLGRGSAWRAGRGDPRVEKIADLAVGRVSAALARAGLSDGPLEPEVAVRRTIGPGDYAWRFHLWRGGALGLAHTLGQSALLRGRQRSRRARGLYFAGSSTLPGVGVPLAAVSATTARELIRRDQP